MRLWPLLHALPGMVWQASSEWVDDKAPRLGAAVAFYTLLSLAPVIVIAVAAAAAVYGQDAARGRLASEIEALAGPAVARTIQEIIRGARQPQAGLIATSLGLATLAFAASSVFVELQDAMNTIWSTPPLRVRTRLATALCLIRNRFYSFALVVGAGFLLLISLVLSTWMAAMEIAVPPAVTFVVSSLATALLFAALYKVLPDVPLTWSDVAPAAVVTSLMFAAGRHLMSEYFGSADVGPAYTAAGSPLVVLLWVYYSAQIFFWGAEFSKVYTRTVGSLRGQ